MRQPWVDPWFHYWHYARRLSCWDEGPMITVEDVNGSRLGGSSHKQPKMATVAKVEEKDEGDDESIFLQQEGRGGGAVRVWC